MSIQTQKCMLLLSQRSNESNKKIKLHHDRSLTDKNKKKLAMAFNSTIRYTDDVLSIYFYFHTFVNSIYPSEFKIKDTTDSEISVSV